MAENKKISALDPLPQVDGTEAIPVVKGGSNFKMMVSQIKAWLGIASSVTSGLMSSADKLKLENIQAGATANATDVQLRDRATHTGTQPASTISGLAEVATVGTYASLLNKPDLTPAGLGAAPASHIGAQGSQAHKTATTDISGFMGPEHVQLLQSLKPIAVTAQYRDLANAPMVRVANMGFEWWPDYATQKGKTHNDYNSYGTAAYVGLAATGTAVKDATECHSFISAAATYSIAGVRSAVPVVKRGNSMMNGGFVFEAVVRWDYTPGSFMGIGVSADKDKAYSNFSGTDVGILIGWNASETGASTLKVRSGNGTDVVAKSALSGTIADAGTYYLRIEMRPKTSAEVDNICTVSAVNLDTGVAVIDKVVIPAAELPPRDTPLYSIVEYGTLAGTAAVRVDLMGLTCQRWREF